MAFNVFIFLENFILASNERWSCASASPSSHNFIMLCFFFFYGTLKYELLSSILREKTKKTCKQDLIFFFFYQNPCLRHSSWSHTHQNWDKFLQFWKAKFSFHSLERTCLGIHKCLKNDRRFRNMSMRPFCQNFGWPKNEHRHE